MQFQRRFSNHPKPRKNQRNYDTNKKQNVQLYHWQIFHPPTFEKIFDFLQKNLDLGGRKVWRNNSTLWAVYSKFTTFTDLEKNQVFSQKFNF